MFLDSSSASSGTTVVDRPKSILKKVTVNPSPSAAWLSYEDGSVKEVPVALFNKMQRVAKDFASSTVVPSMTPGFRGTGMRDSRDPNISGGSLEGPDAVSTPLVSSNSPSPVDFSEPNPGPSQELARKARQSKGTSSLSSGGARVTVPDRPLTVDPRGELVVRLLALGQG